MPRSNSRRSHSRSQTRSRSRTRSRSNSRGRNGRSYSRGRNGRYSDDRSYNDLCRVHIADLTEKVTKSDIEKAFGKYGEVEEVWMAKNPPCFAFVVFKNKEDAGDAIKEMDGRSIAGYRVRVTQARPRVRQNNNNNRRRYNTDMRCYQCGQRGHLSRECDEYSKKKRRYSRSASRDRGSHRGGGRGGRSRSKSYSRSRSRSLPPRERKTSETVVDIAK